MSKQFTIMEASLSLVWSSIVKYCTDGHCVIQRHY